MSFEFSRGGREVRPIAASGGFTLIELLVAFGVGLVLLAVLVTLFASNSSNQNELERTLRRVENARFAIDALREDILHAGFFSDVNPNALPVAPSWQTLADPSCTVFSGNDSTVMGWNTAVTPVTIPVAVQGIAAATDVACLTAGGRRANTEAVALRRADTGNAISRAAMVANNLYIQVSRCPDDLRRFAVASVGGAAALSLRLPNCAAQNDAVRRLVQRTYFVSNCNDCAANDGIPTLKRVESIDNALRTTAVAEGVENFQLEYGEDTNGDGRPDGFVKAAAVANWANVLAVRVHMLIRSTERSPGYADTRTYQLGQGVQVVAPADGFKRTLFTDTIRLVNVGGRLE